MCLLSVLFRTTFRLAREACLLSSALFWSTPLKWSSSISTPAGSASRWATSTSQRTSSHSSTPSHSTHRLQMLSSKISSHLKRSKVRNIRRVRIFGCLEAATNSKKVVMDLLTLQILRTLRKVLLAKCLSKLISRPIQGLERAKSPSKVCARNQLLTLSLITDQMFLFQLLLAFSCCCQRFEMAQGSNVQAVRGGELDRPASVR